MTGLVVRSNRGNLSVTFNLSAFITDWEGAKKDFPARIIENFGGLLNPQPSDFSAHPSSELGEAWCKYRVFGGSSTIILRADTMSLSFVNIFSTDFEFVAEIVGRTMENLLPRLNCYERQSYRELSNYHAQVIEGDPQKFLKHHGSKSFGAAAESDATVEYRPVVGFTLRSRDGSRAFHQVIEQSEDPQNDLFISDSSHVSLPGISGMEEEMSWRQRMLELASRTTGIVHEGNKHSED